LVSLSVQIQLLLIHRPGGHSDKPEALSLWADHQAKKEEDNQDQVMLSPEKFHGLAELSESLAENGLSPLSINFGRWRN